MRLNKDKTNRYASVRNQFGAWYFFALFLCFLPKLGFAETLVAKLEANGFHCIFLAEQGYICSIPHVQTHGFSYSQPVAILLPLRLSRPHPTDILLYLHGFRSGSKRLLPASPPQLTTQFRLLEQLNDSDAMDSVLVLPTSLGNCDSFHKELVPQYKQFHAWLEKLLEPETKNLFIAGHSGAGRIIADLINQYPALANLVVSVILLDATYANYCSPLGTSLKHNLNNQIVDSIYRSQSPTAYHSLELESCLGRQRGNFEATRMDHFEIPRQKLASLFLNARKRIYRAP